jgi:alkylated DNA repair dioxygenase AlkB
MYIFHLIIVMSSKKKYIRYTHNLIDEAHVVHIPAYVKDPDMLFNELKSGIDWERFKYTVYDKEVLSPRLMQIINFDDDTEFSSLYAIKKRIEKLLGITFSYAVLNYYRDGNDYISYHADREVSDGQTVASVTVGSTRRFHLKHKYKSNIKYTFMLGHGDVLILNDIAIKKKYKHSVPKMANVGPRINITFRE